MLSRATNIIKGMCLERYAVNTVLEVRLEFQWENASLSRKFNNTYNISYISKEDGEDPKIDDDMIECSDFILCTVLLCHCKVDSQKNLNWKFFRLEKWPREVI
jgi:hypothetical protein